jgi:hypothetical protein
MLPLHDRVRRRICIAGFFALAIAPTVAVLGLALAWRLPGHVSAEAERMGHLLGMDVRLEAVEHPLPGVVRYRGLVLSSPETGRTVASCPWLEARRQTLERQGKPRPVLLLRAWQPEVEIAEVAELGRLVGGLIGLRLGNSRCDVHLAAPQILLKVGDRSMTLTDVRGDVRTDPAATEAALRFGPASLETGEQAKFCLGRNRQTQPAADWFAIDTAGGALPCDLLGLAVAPLRSLGAQAQFRGSLWAALVADGWQGEIRGSQFSGVDLDRLVTDRFGRQLSGLALVAIDHAQFRGGRVEEIHGWVTAGPGKVSRSLMEAAVVELGLGGSAAGGSDAAVSYEQLACSFDANASGLRVDGLCQAKSGAVMCDARGQLLGSFEQPQQRRPIAALVRALAPRAAEQLPVSPETDWLSRRLPLMRQR